MAKKGDPSVHTRRRKPSAKQILALELINKGEKPRKAMLRAGFSPSTARNPGNNLLNSPTIISIVDQMKLRLENKGITALYLADKLGELASSDNPKVFYGAYDRLKPIVGIEQNINKQDEGTIKRKFEYTEWINSLPNETPKIVDHTEDSALSDILDDE